MNRHESRIVNAPSSISELSFALRPESKKRLDKFITDAQTHGLVIIVGAGINGKAVVQWNALLRSLLTMALSLAKMEDTRFLEVSEYIENWFTSHFDVCAQASVIKHILGAERYRITLKDAIYKQFSDFDAVLKQYCEKRLEIENHPQKDYFEFLYTVAKLCDSPHVKAVATFNYDTLLETAIKATTKIGRNPRPHYGHHAASDHDAGPKDLPIFHIHGLLSPPGAPLRDSFESVVLSFDEYFNTLADPISWETSTPLHLLRNYCTLWLGTSLKDWNMLRLLDACHAAGHNSKSYCIQSLAGINADLALRPPLPEHTTPTRYAQECREFYEAYKAFEPQSVQFRKAAMRLHATLLDSVGVNLIVTGDDHTHVSETLNKRIIPKLKSKKIRNTHRTNAKAYESIPKKNGK